MVVHRSNRARSGFDLPDEMIQRFAKRLLTERPIDPKKS